MLHIWVGKYERYDAVHKPDTYFDINFDYKLTGTDFARRLIHDCSQESEVIAPGYFKHPTRGYYSLDKLPTGIKSVLLAKYNPEVVVDLVYMGDNCFPYLAEIANKQEVTVCTGRYVKLFPPLLKCCEFKGGIHVLNTDEIITSIDDWFMYYAHHDHDVIENEPDAVDPFDLSNGENKLSGSSNPEIYLYTKEEIFSIRLKTKYTILKGDTGAGKSYLLKVVERASKEYSSHLTARVVSNIPIYYVDSRSSIVYIHTTYLGVCFLDKDALGKDKDFAVLSQKEKDKNMYVIVSDGLLDGISEELQTVCELGKDTDIIEVTRR